jgi:mannose-P-dolichol utilization defect protein 1
MGAGSLLLYSPIVLRLVRTWDAQGMAASTWALQLFGFTAACIYNYAKGHSLSAYGETLVFAVQVCAVPSHHTISTISQPLTPRPPQSGAILLLVCHLQQRLRTRAFACGAAAFCALLCWAAAGLPPVALALLQLLSSVVVTSALLPQLLLNARRRSSGGWSPLTAGLSACGNALRVFTTLQLTHDALLLAGYMAGFAVNAALLAQIVVFGEGAQSSPS